MSVTVRIGSRYVARAVIGHGSFGTVFRADGPDGPVAVKLLRPDLASSPEVVNRFLRERSVLLGMAHPNLVRVRDLVVEGDVLAMVMELIEGPDLRARLHAAGALLPVDAARVVADVAAGLSYAHAHGVVHRDVKPENVLLRDGSTPLLTDFGIARLVANAATISGQQEVLGTPAYLAPELALGGAAAPAADVYACGVLLYELVTGQPPFVADHPLSVVHQHVTDPPRRPAGMPGELWRVVAACLAKQPEERPDADTLRVLLAEWAARPTDAAALTSAADAGAATGDEGSARETAVRQAETRAVPMLAGPVQSRTQVMSTVAGRAGRATAPPPAAVPPEDGWQPPAPERRPWLLYAAALVATAAVFLAAGYWLGDASRQPAAPAPTPTPSESAQPKSEIRYLSQLAFVQVANGWGPVELDKATGNTAPDDGGPLILGDKTYERGLGAHAPSHVRVYPPEGCRELKAVVGIDASAVESSGGTVSFQVHADGQLSYDSGIITWQDQPKPIQVDVAGATMVDLIVTDGGDGNHWDISDWADAQLICEN
ncbi:MAG: protein kinase domain-containing protein [Micromonosporaceae bacterium]